jgi:EmrB/QacA subfamily drug resistance transporter
MIGRSTNPAADETPASGWRAWGALATVTLAVTVIVMDGSIVNVALPTLARALEGASNSHVQWIVDAYILAFAAMLPAAGSAADRFGRRRVMVLGLVVFGLMSAGGATAQTAGQLIAWRAAMGVGAAMIFPSTLAIITDTFADPTRRRRAIAVWAGSSGLGVALGPVAGGWLLEHFDWGSVFLVNLPVIAVVLVGSALLVRPSADPSPARLDLAGNVLAVMAIVTLVFGLIEGPVYGWGSWRIAGALGLSAVLWTFFGWWEARTPAAMLDVRVFRQHRFTGACVAISAAFFGLFGFVFMVTQYLQFVQGYSALQAGVRTLPFAGFILCGTAVAARPGSPRGQGRIPAAGLVLMAAGFAWVSQDTQHTPYATLVWQMALLGVGLGLVNTAATEVIMNALPERKAGVGSSINDTTRELGGTLGVAVMGSVFNSVYRAGIADGFTGSPMPADAVAAIRQSLGGAMAVLERVEQVAGKTAQAAARVPVVGAFEQGFHASAWVASGGALAGAGLTLWLMSEGGRSRVAACSPGAGAGIVEGA